MKNYNKLIIERSLCIKEINKVNVDIALEFKRHSKSMLYYGYVKLKTVKKLQLKQINKKINKSLFNTGCFAFGIT